MAKNFTHNDLRKLVRNKKNQELKAIMTKVRPTDLIDKSGRTLLHLAAKYGNLELIKHLLLTRSPQHQPSSTESIERSLDHKSHLNATCSSGMTPLMTAVAHNQFDAARLLLNFQPDIFARDASGLTALQMAVKRRAPARVVQKFIARLRELNVSTTMTVLMLERAGCSLKTALSFNDVAILRAMLERRETVGYFECSRLIREAMNYRPSEESVANLVTLLRHGPGPYSWKWIFYEKLSDEVEAPFPSLIAPYLKALVEQLIKAEAIDGNFVGYLTGSFTLGDKQTVKLWLGTDVHAHVKRQFDWDLTTHLFGNRYVNASRLMQKREVDVDGRGRDGFGALHFATRIDHYENVEFLLGRGADPNFKSDFGQTPLFLARDRRCAKLLLRAGADVQAVDAEGSTILEGNRCYETQELVLAQLAVVEGKGEEVESYMREKINANRRFKEYYQKCRAQVDWMKRRRVFRSVTLFDVFIDKPENIARHVTNREKGAGLMDWHYECPLQRYYFSILKRNLKEAVKIHELKCKAALVVATMTRLFDAEHLVVRKVVGYLSYENLLVFA